MAGRALDISKGGTSQTTAPGARIALGLEIGVDVQAHDIDLDALAALNTTGIIVRTGSGTVATRTITGTANEITLTNGDGVAGNPTVSLPTALTFTGKTVTGGTFASIALSGTFQPTANDGVPLGASGTAFSDLFLASGGVINWNAGDVTITHSADALSFGGAANGYSFDQNINIASGKAINWNAGDVTVTHSANLLAFAGASSGYTFDAVVKPSANDAAALGASGTAWSDAFFASGAVIDFAAGDYTLTHSTGILTANKDFRVTTAGTNTASVVTVGGTQTLTNKTLTTPSLTLQQSSSPTPTAEGDIQWDTDDNAIVVGDGSGQKIFRANNWEFIGKSDPSSASSVDFTNLSAYRMLRLIGWFIPATDAVAAYVRTSTDNGSTFASTLGDYINNYLFQSGGAAAGTSSANDTGVEIFATGVGNAAPESGFFDMILYEFNQSAQCHMLCTFGELNNVTSGFVGIMQGRRTNSTARNAIRFITASGNIASGHFELWGTRGTA